MSEENSSGRRKMILDGNLDLDQGMKITRNGKYVDKYKRHFPHFKISLKYN